MEIPRYWNRAAGFTLVELTVIVTIILLSVIVGYPAFALWADKARITGVVQSVSAKMQMARQEAIRTNRQVVVQPDFDNDEILFFVNVDEDPGYELDLDDTAPHRTADYELARLRLPTEYDILFSSATDPKPEGKDSVVGLTPTNAPLNAVVFLPDGSVMDSGAIRLADKRSNSFEVRIEPRATGRVRVNKYHFDPPWGDKPGFFPRGRHRDSDDPMWVWY